MQLFKASVDWYSDWDGSEHKDEVLGFGKNILDFTDRLVKEFDDIMNLNITCVNYDTAETQLIYLPPDEKANKALMDENNF